MNKTKEAVATWTAVGALFVFVVLVAIMVSRRDAQDPEWSRLVYLFTGVEAVAFAGVGFLWGKEVNRPRAEKAEKELRALANQVKSAADELQAQAPDLIRRRLQDLYRMASDLT